MIFVIDPALTNGGDRARELLDEARDHVEQHSPTCFIATDAAAYEACPGSADGLLLANPAEEQALPEAVFDLVERAKAAGTVVLPVALEPGRRRPPAPVKAAQSYDVHDRLRLRSLPPSALPVIAQELSRTILSLVQPTLTKDSLRLFLCHRRADAEDITRRLDQALSNRHEHTFRDLVNVRPTADAQQAIEDYLGEADVLVFLDTPLVGESNWVIREVELALGQQIPVVWVRINTGRSDRVPMRASPMSGVLSPADTPHLEVTVTDAEDPSVDWHSLADDILDAVFTVAREHVRVAQQTFSRIRRRVQSRGWAVEVLDQRQMIYALIEPEDSSAIYPRRPRTDIVQVFGHRPRDADRGILMHWLADKDYGPHGRSCRAFDAAILLDPLPRATAAGDGIASVVEYGAAYLQRLTDPVPNPSTAQPRRLLLLGAFPEGIDSQEPVKQAAHALATTWLARGGYVTFGGHPTFTPLITEAARQLLGVTARDRVTIYQSRFWVTDAMASALEQLARVELVDAAADMPSSLTAMRRRMVSDVASDVVAVIGGRTSEGGTHSPGVDEEMELARSAGYPIYLIGAPGGRAAELAAESEATGWIGLSNRFDVKANRLLAKTDEYQEIAELLWSMG